MLNWCLGAAATALWGGSAIWYFRREVAQLWRQRHDKWFRDGL